MVFDTNLLIEHIRRQEMLPARAIIPVIVVGELEAFALKADWAYQKLLFMQRLFERFPVVESGQSTGATIATWSISPKHG
eukprot:gene49473-60573_t